MRKIIKHSITFHTIEKEIVELKKPYGVARSDGKIIDQFEDIYSAILFSEKLNFSYSKNDIKDKSIVVKL